jgi:hypothetical protein
VTLLKVKRLKVWRHLRLAGSFPGLLYYASVFIIGESSLK